MIYFTLNERGRKKLFPDSQAVKRTLIELFVLHRMSVIFQQTPLHQLFTFLIKQQAWLGLFFHENLNAAALYRLKSTFGNVWKKGQALVPAGQIIARVIASQAGRRNWMCTATRVTAEGISAGRSLPTRPAEKVEWRHLHKPHQQRSQSQLCTFALCLTWTCYSLK